MDATIPVEYLRECFEHREDGALIWRARPAHHFDTAKLQAMVNGRCAGKVAATKNAEDYLVVSLQWQGRQRKLLVARVIWAMEHGAWPANPLDHINRVRGDNRLENLRDVPWSVNAANRGARGSYQRAEA